MAMMLSLGIGVLSPVRAVSCVSRVADRMILPSAGNVARLDLR